MGSFNSFDQLTSALFGKTKRSVLALLFTQPDKSFYVREITRFCGLGQGTVQRELQHLTEAGILTRRRQGNQVLYQANQDCPIFNELKSLVIKTAGVGDILRKAFTKIKNKIQAAFIFGSFAKGENRSASDIDLMVIGDISFREVVSHLQSPQELLGREINPSVYTSGEFQKKLALKHHFISTIVKEPKIMLIGEEHELTKLGNKRLGHKA